MAQKLDRQKRNANATNPFMEIPKKEPNEPLKTMKVPESTHKKLLALAKINNQKLYEMIDRLAEEYIEGLSEDEKAVFLFMQKDK